MAQRYEFYFQVRKQYFTNEPASKILFLPRENKIHNWLEKTQVKILLRKLRLKLVRMHPCKELTKMKEHFIFYLQRK